MARVGVIGSGSWGTALSWLLCNNGHRVTLWSHHQEDTEMFCKLHQNVDKLPGVVLPDTVVYTSDLTEACENEDLLILAVPSRAIRSTAAQMKNSVRDHQMIVSVAKGIEEETLKTLSEVIEEEIPQADVAILSGPSHAEEVGRGIPTAVVVGAHSRDTAETVQKFFISPVFRVYTSSDMLGIQLGGALKNVIALAAGMSDGMCFGDNTKAALITRGSAEITRLGLAMGAKMETLYGLSGIGDLIVTCASVHSRNRKAGFLIGQGKTMQEAVDSVHMVVEGVYSARAGDKLSERYGVEMPIIHAVNQVLFENRPAAIAVMDLMQRVGKDEFAGTF